MRTKIYYVVLFNLLFAGLSRAQQTPQHTNEADNSFFNYKYWEGVASKRQLSPSDRTEFISSQKRVFEESQHGHRTFHDSELVWVKEPVTGRKLGGATTFTGPCTNIDFEAGNLTGWVRSTGYHPLYNAAGCCTTVNGAQAIVSGTGTDPYGAFPVVAPGGSFSLRLGNNALNGVADRIEQTFSVTPQNANFTYRYAIVLNDNGHPVSQQPAFTIEMIDSTGFQVPCTMYTVAAASNISGFQTSSVTGGSPLAAVVFKPWTTVALDLTPVIGTNITIRFTTYDCSQGGHFGYAYIDGSCGSFQTNNADTTCPGVPKNMCAPAGFATYFWNGPNSFTSNAQCVNVTEPGTYSCQTVLVPGCPGPTFNHTLTLRPKPAMSFTPVTTGACAVGYTFNSTSSITAGSSISSYIWDFGDNTGTFLQSPAHSFPSFGTYTVEFKATSDKGCSDSVAQAITVYPFPTLAYSPPSNCVNTVVQFTNTSTIPGAPLNTISSYTWNLGNGLTSNLINPTNTYTSQGPFNVTLSATSNQGCVSSLSSTLGIFPPPVVTFTTNNMCFGNSTAFTNTSTIASGTLIGFNWNFGDGTGSTNANPVRTFTAPGSYVVTFSATSNHNCVDSETKTVTIHPNPVPSFTPSSVCLNTATSFTNTSQINPFPYTISSYTWNFGNGNFSNLTTPAFTFTTPGTHNVTLTAMSPEGCFASTVTNVQVNYLPSISFSPPSACMNTAIQFTNTSSITGPASITSYSWNFGNGNTTNSANPVYTYTLGNTYTIVLSAMSNQGCSATAVNTLEIWPEPVANFSAGNNCQLTAISFSNTSTIPSPGNIPFYSWTFGNGGVSSFPNPSYTYSNSGTYTVNLTATSNHGCVNSYSQALTAHPLPTVNIAASAVCPSLSTTFTNNSTGVITSYSWDFGDGSAAGTGLTPVHTYTASNNYLVQLTATSNQGCISVGNTTAVVYPSPVLNFSPPGACAGSAINFTNTSTIAYGSITSYLWNFGNGNTSTSVNPVYSYPVYGSYTVNLTATSNQGCITTNTVPLAIHPVAAADFTYANTCFGNTTQFQGTTSIVPSATVNFMNWDFGNGFYSTGLTSGHVYNTSNTFAVTFSATTNNGCVSAVTKTIVINPVPQISFSAAPQCLNNVTSFTNASSISGATNTINQWSWNFDDGSGSTQQSPAHTYTTFGTYTAVLSGTSNVGCTSTSSAVVVVHPLPNVVFSPPSACVGTAIQFTNSSTIQSGVITGYTWTLGNSQTSNLVNPVFTYTAPNNYNISLTAVSDMGCTRVQTNNLGIYPYPQVTVTPLANGCVNDGVTLNPNTFMSTPPGLNSSITSYSWNFGNSSYSVVNTSTIAPATHSYASYGTFTVVLSAISSQGCQTDDSTFVTIYPKPNPAFVVQKFCHTDSTIFLNTSTIPSGSITSHLWLYNDGISSSTLKDPKYVFSSPNTYTVILNETSNPEPGVACSQTVANTVTINPRPQPAFTYSAVCFGDQMNFANLTPSTNIVAWSWDFEKDGIPNTSAFNASNTFSSAGLYTVVLSARNTFSCVNEVSQVVQVYSNPTASFAATSVCYKDNTVFTNLSAPGDANSIINFKWNFAGQDSSVLASPQYSFAAPGVHTVELKVESALGCRSKYTTSVTVYHLPVAQFTALSACLGAPTQFVNQSYIADASNLTYSWDYMNDGLDDSSATSAITPFTYPNSGGYLFRLQARSDKGCIDNKIGPVMVYANPTAAFLTSKVCVGDNIVFTSISSSPDGTITTYLWDFNGDNVSDKNEQSPSFTYSLTGDYLPKLTVVTEYGCTHSRTRPLYANPKAVAAYRTDKTSGCPPLCVNFEDLSTISHGTFTTTWNFGDLSPVTGNRNPTHCFGSGTYDLKLELVSDSGCTTVLEHPTFLNVFDLPTAGFKIEPDEVDENEPNITVTSKAENAVSTRYFISDGTAFNTTDFDYTLKYLDGKSKTMIVQVVKNEAGCSDTTYDLIKIKPAFSLYFPDAFTPNGDGINDQFQPKGVGIVEFYLQIYDRWGHVVFTSTDFLTTWDGQKSDDPDSIKQDVYTWRAQVVDVNRKKHELLGHVTLVR